MLIYGIYNVPIVIINPREFRVRENMGSNGVRTKQNL